MGETSGREPVSAIAPVDSVSVVAAPVPERRADPPQQFPVVGVGASAGGLAAFIDLFERLPIDTGMAFVVIQHLDPNRPSLLAETLGRVTRLPVTEVAEGVQVAP